MEPRREGFLCFRIEVILRNSANLRRCSSSGSLFEVSNRISAIC